MPGALLWGYDATNKKWIPLQVDANGYVKVDLSNINLDDLADVNAPSPSDNDALTWDAATSKWVPQAFTAAAHAASHQNGGGDEINVAGLSGELADNQPPKVHGDPAHTETYLKNVVEDTTPQLGGALDCLNNALTNLLGLLFKTPTELTIATGVITVTQAFHTVDTEGDAASDDLATINGGATVNMIIIKAADGARTVVVKHNTGNIWLQGKADVTLDDLEDGLLLVWDSTNSKWFDIAAGGAAGATTWLGLTDTPASFSGKAGQIPKVNAGQTALEFDPRGFKLIGDAEVTGSAVTYLELTGLDGNADGFWLIIVFHVNPLTIANNGELLLNNDTGNNYDYEYVLGEGGAVTHGTGTRGSLSMTSFLIGSQNEVGMCFCPMYLKSGKPRPCFPNQGVNNRRAMLFFQTWTNTADNITSLRFTSNQTNGLGVGSRIMVFGKA